MNLRAFSPPTLDTFAAHWRRCAYLEARCAIRELRAAGCHRHVWLALGRADAAVSVLYDLNHPQAHMVLRHVRGVRNAVDRYLEKQKRSHVQPFVAYAPPCPALDHLTDRGCLLPSGHTGQHEYLKGST